MDLTEYQIATRRTSQFAKAGPETALGPLLGLANKAGSILNVYKKYLRDSIDLGSAKELIDEQLGDLLWYVAAVADHVGLSLDEVASHNLVRTGHLWGTDLTFEGSSALPTFDARFPPTEQLPRLMIFEFSEQDAVPGNVQAQIVASEPYAFPDGPIVPDGGASERGFALSSPLGDVLTDNAFRPDGYRYHDAVHITFAAVLHWSPTLRKLLRLKRKSSPDVDEVEDGARAVLIEEGLSAVLARMGDRRLRYGTESSVDTETLEVVSALVGGLEVDVLPGWVWRRAIRMAFSAMDELARNSGGFLVADLNQRSVRYTREDPRLVAGRDSSTRSVPASDGIDG